MRIKKKADILLKDLIQEYPLGYFRFIGGFFSLRRGQLDQATVYFNQIYEECKYFQMKLRANYELGNCHWLQLNWEKALVSITTYVEESKALNFKAFGALKAGICCEMLGNNEKAMQFWAKVANFVRPNMAFDKYALRKATQFIKQGRLTEYDKEALSAWILNDSKSFQLAIDHSRKAIQFATTVDQQAFAYYIQGMALKELKKYSEAYDSFQRVIRFDGKIVEEIYIVPHSFFELGDMYRLLHKKADAEKSLYAAQAYKGIYDFDRFLKSRLKQCLEKVSKLPNTTIITTTSTSVAEKNS